MVSRWRRPLLVTYNDNYRYGTSLYSGTVGDVEKKYRDSLSRTQLRSDRGDLGLSTFSGSHLHGGLAAGSTGSTAPIGTSTSTKLPENDLYAPLSFGYGRSYYNSLRGGGSEPRDAKATEPTTKSSSYHSSSSEEISKDIKTTKTSSSDYDNIKKTVTTTTTSEKWMPLSQYLYPSTTTYYYYTSPYTTKTSDMYFLDEVKQKSASSKSNIEDMDLKVSSSSAAAYDKFDYNFWMDKCHDIQSQLDHVNHWVSDAESKIRSDVVGARNRMQTELADVTMLVDDTTKYNEELQGVIRRQAKQISQLHSQYDEINRYLGDVSDNLEKSRLRCQSLQAELANVQSGLSQHFSSRNSGFFKKSTRLNFYEDEWRAPRG